MKHLKIKLFLIILISMTSNNIYSFSVKNNQGITIYYNYINEDKELEVVRNGVYTYTDYSDIIIPEEVTYMGRTRKVTSIANYTFRNCGKLSSISIPKSIKTIGKEAFYGCTGLKKIIIKDIAAWCDIDFQGEYNNCSNPLQYARHLYSDENTEIKELVIPYGVKNIKNYAFFNCNGITSVKIPNSVTEIGISTFYECTGLQKVIINDIAVWCNIKFKNYSNPLYYAQHLYSDENTEIKELVIPNSVETIEGYAFCGCSGLTSVKFLNNLTTIGNYAFSGCSGLTSIIFSDNLTTIGNYAFYGCFSLTSITIPNNVITIGDGSFYGCYNLTSITIPNSFITIGDYAFNLYNGYDHNKPVDIISLKEEPENISEDVFSKDLYKNATLFVPKGTINKYKNCDGWKKFVYIEEISETNNIEKTPANAVLIQSANGVLNISGVNDGANVSVYTLSGQMVGASKAIDNQTSIITDLQKGEIVIVKIGEKSVKVIMQ